jgi:hypothetical protein
MPPLAPISFPPGKIYYSPQAQKALRMLGVSGLVLLQRHIKGDWGDVDAKRSQVNTLVASGRGTFDKDIQVISRYSLAGGRVVIMVSTRHVHTAAKRQTDITLVENGDLAQSKKRKGAKKKKDGRQQLSQKKVQPGHSGRANGGQPDRSGSHPERVINQLGGRRGRRAG